MIPLPAGAMVYVVGAVVALGVVVGAHEIGHARATRVGESRLAAYQAQAEAESAKLRAKAAQVSERVVIQYRDRVKEIRVPEPVEVVREIEVIRQSDCKLPASWVRLHDSAARGGSDAAAGSDEAAEITCAAAIEVIRENIKRFRENALQLKALQEWAASVAS